MSKQYIENINIEQLHPYENNSRVHTDSQIEKLRNSIKEFGFIKPIIIDENNTILAGHGIFYAAQAEGFETIPCIRNTNLTEAQKKAYIIADNKLSDMSYFDMTIVIDELKTLNSVDFDTLITGFDIADLLSDDLSSIDSFFEDKITAETEKEQKKNTVLCPFCGEEFDI